MNKTARVCWVPDQDDEGRPLRRQTWRDGRPKSAPPAENAPQVDLHSRERGGLMETLARLAGRAITYEPGAGTQKLDTVPFEHTLAMACAWLGEHPESPHDVSGDLIMALAMMHVRHEDRIVRALGAVMSQTFGLARGMRESLRDACCRSIVRQCVYGTPQPRPPRATAAQWGLHQGFGTRALWVIAERGLERVSRALAYPAKNA